MRKFVLAAMLAGAPCAAWSAPLPAPAGQPCREQPAGRALDFWVGDWKVVDAKDGSPLGENRVDRILDGCAIIENWHGADAGDDGKSLFAYDANAQTWEQVWVTQDTSRPGGLKHKRMVAAYPDGSVRFEGEIPLKDGRIILDRTTLVPMKDGRVRQTIEDSRDGGTSWIAGFDAFYIRK